MVLKMKKEKKMMDKEKHALRTIMCLVLKTLRQPGTFISRCEKFLTDGKRYKMLLCKHSF